MTDIKVEDSLAVKYRPKILDDIVGNKSNIDVISGFFKQRKLVKTWLLSGDSGSGKTTLARMIAMTVNCQDLQGINPCLKCASCKQALTNSHPDIHELNASGESGNVDELRKVLDYARLSPKYNYRVFLLDECLTGDTLVEVTEGEFLPIKDIVNDLSITHVLSFNFDTKMKELKEIIGRSEQKVPSSIICTINLSNNEKVNCTTNHEWYCESKNCYIRTWDLYSGEKLNNFLSIKSLRRSHEKSEVFVYDIEVEDNHNFYVKVGEEKLLSHNCHGLSGKAKQEILKPLEEPPAKTMWILCTTEPEKLAEATYGRCLKLFFTYPIVEEVSEMLRKIAKKEFDDSVYKSLKPFFPTIVEGVGCQPRNAISTLELVASAIYNNPDCTKKEVRRLVKKYLLNSGVVDALAIKFVLHIACGKKLEPLKIASKLEESRVNEFLSVVFRYSNYAIMYFLNKQEGTKVEREGFYGLSFIRFEQALDKIEKMCDDINFFQLCASTTTSLEKIRTGVIPPKQSVLYLMNDYFKSLK